MADCSVEGCGSPILCKGLCNAHRLRLKKWGTVAAEIPVRDPKPRPCSAKGCLRLAVRRGFCEKHAQRFATHGHTNDPIRVQDHRGPWAGCWDWGTDQAYPLVWVDGHKQRLNRAVWEALFGPVPPGLFVCHRCDNPRCYRPEHLFLGTSQDNHLDMQQKGRIARGVKSRHAKLTEDDVREVRRRIEDGQSGRSIARSLGVKESCISAIKHRRTWAWLK